MFLSLFYAWCTCMVVTATLLVFSVNKHDGLTDKDRRERAKNQVKKF